MAVERVLSNLNLISFKTEGGLQNHIDELQDGDLVFTPDNSLKGNLFDFKWTDHKLNDISWLNADTFSWQSGDVYVAAFEHLVSDLFQKAYAWQYEPTQGGEVGYTKSETPEVGQYLYTGSNKNLITEVGSGYLVVQNYKTGDSQRFERIDADIESSNVFAEHETETIGSTTIAFYRADDGHKICLVDQESKVQAIYEATGVAWYYIFDIINKQFKLPRTKHAFTGLRDEVGGYVKAGLPNITGQVGNTTWNVNGIHGSSGALYWDKTNLGNYGASTQSVGSASVAFDASRSSSVYGNSNTVQPEATQMYLYFYVGNFEQSALEQTAGLNAELFNSKADVDLGNLPTNIDYVVESQEPTSSNSNTWYRKYKSGWVEQGGKVNLNGQISATNKRITLPVEMANNNYLCIAACNANVASPAYIGWEATTGFSIGINANASNTGWTTWLVAGMAKQ